MKISDILDAIEITDARPKAYAQLLTDSWTTARFGRDLVGLHDNPVALGRALLKENDFFAARSGLTDDHHVTFKLDDIKRGHKKLSEQAIYEHLQWMVDSRCDSAIIDEVLKAINKGGRRGATSFLGDLPKVMLQRLAKDLFGGLLREEEKDLTRALLEGEFFKISEEAEKLTAPVNPVIIRRIREMMILWALMDLQIMAARLFHAEWNALERGGSGPELTSVGTVRKLLQEFMKAAEIFVKAFRTGRDDPALPSKYNKFLREHGLEEHARRNARSMGLDEAQLVPGAITRERRDQIKRYLKFVRQTAKEILGGFDASMKPNAKTHTRTDHAKVAGKTGKITLAPRQFDSKKDVEGIFEASMSTSTIRLSMPVVTALIYGIQRVVAAVGALPADERIVTYRADAELVPRLWSETMQAEIRGRLLQVYRHLFVRDHRRLGTAAADGDQHHGPSPRMQPAPAANPGKWANVMGVGQRPSDMVLEGSSRRQPKEAIADAHLLNAYRAAPVQDPEDDYIDRKFESSLAGRLNREGAGLKKKKS